jgi:hypothetical protein
MSRVTVVTSVLVLLAVAATATTVDIPGHAVPLSSGVASRDFLAYDNSGSSVFRSNVNPPRALDDGSFNPGPAAGGNVVVTGVQAAFFAIGTAPASFDFQLNFYDTVDPNADPVNSSPLGGIRFAFTNIAPGAYTTGQVSIPGGLLFPDDNWAVDALFLLPGTDTLATGLATVAFFGGGVNTGSSADLYWRDADGNGQYDPTDARNFGGAPNLANFYLQLNVPEPASLLLLLSTLICRRR